LNPCPLLLTPAESADHETWNEDKSQNEISTQEDITNSKKVSNDLDNIGYENKIIVFQNSQIFEN
jgi:hypothetical protein